MKTDLLDIRHQDCMDLMAEFPDKHFDLAVTSPPYNMNLRVNQKGDGYTSRQIVEELSTKYNHYQDNLPMEQYELFLAAVLDELLRVSQLVFFNIQMITGNKPALFRFMGNYADQIKEVVIWDKGHAQPAIRDGVLNSRYEFVLIFGDKPITRRFSLANFDRGTLDNLWNIKKQNSADCNHKASFPINFVTHILKNFAHPNSRIIDPFLGTGTTAIACHYAKHHLTACELDKEYYDAACERIKRETAQIELF